MWVREKFATAMDNPFNIRRTEFSKCGGISNVYIQACPRDILDLEITLENM